MAVYNSVNGVLTPVAGANRSIVIQVNVPIQTWSVDANGVKYSTVQVPDIKQSDNPIASLYIKSDDTADTAKKKREAFSYIDRITTANGSITMYCLGNDVPTVEFDILLRR